VGRRAVRERGHERRRAAEDERLPREAIVEDERAVDRGHARLVPTVSHAGVDALEDACRMQLPGEQGLRIARGAEAEDVRVEEEAPAAAPGADSVAIAPEDPGDRSPVRIEGGGRVVRLDLEREVRLGVDAHDARVVVEHGHHEALAPSVELREDLARRADDAGLEDRSDGPQLAALVIVDRDVGRELLVFAVLRPRLGEDLELAVGRLGREAVRGAIAANLFAREVIANGVHLREGQSERAGRRELGEPRVVGRERDALDPRLRVKARLGGPARRKGELSPRERVNVRVPEDVPSELRQGRVGQRLVQYDELLREERPGGHGLREGEREHRLRASSLVVGGPGELREVNVRALARRTYGSCHRDLVDDRIRHGPARERQEDVVGDVA
jgi:hypothetical protein